MPRLRHIIRLWLSSDRIRVSPREAKLLRLTPGTCIRIGGAAYVVESRIACGTGNAVVTYHCRGISDEMDLIASIADDGSIHATMKCANRAKPIAIDEIDCFG